MKLVSTAVLAAVFPVLALAQTGAASVTLDEARAKIEAQSDEWMLDHLAVWLRANGCMIGKDREQDFQKGVLGLVLENLQLPTELHADLIPAADARMEQAADAWFASGKAYEELGLVVDLEADTLRADPC